ncbi:MAG: undecaprenyldiphospho-muramoylpentapeptide beta-N-acetylglucosaminyltransferase [Acidimicrobiia bacterium]
MIGTAGCFAVVTGGGTSGHVLPALAIAEGLVAAGHDPPSIHYVGARRGIETRLLPPTPFPHTFLDVIGLQRRLAASNLVFPLKLAGATATAFRLLRRLRPEVVVSVGGYASLPAVISAWLLRIPIVVVSYDRRPGQSSRLAARIAAASAVAFPDASLPRARYTGAPLRQSILAVDPSRDRDAARRALDLPLDRFVVVVVGGSLGSGVLNDAVSGLVDRWSDRRDLAVRHIVGERFLGRAASARGGDTGILYQVIGYEEEMPLVYAAADVVVARAGASTIAELAAVGVPAILVPWAGAAEDHQTANANALGEPGAAIVVPEAELSGERLLAEVDALAGDPARLAAMARIARSLGEVHRSNGLVRLVEEVATR